MALLSLLMKQCLHIYYLKNTLPKKVNGSSSLVLGCCCSKVAAYSATVGNTALWYWSKILLTTPVLVAVTLDSFCSIWSDPDESLSNLKGVCSSNFVGGIGRKARTRKERTKNDPGKIEINIRNSGLVLRNVFKVRSSLI